MFCFAILKCKVVFQQQQFVQVVYSKTNTLGIILPTSLAISLVGDGLNDALNPKLRSR